MTKEQEIEMLLAVAAWNEAMYDKGSTPENERRWLRNAARCRRRAKELKG